MMAVNPTVYLGAKPVFIDIDPATYNLRPELVEASLTAKTKLIVAQHTYGYPADMNAIMDIARRKGLPVLEDCCLALGAEYASRVVGTFGVAAYFSFQWNKPYTSGLGGMAVTCDADLATRIEEIQAQVVAPSATEVMMLRAQLGLYRSAVYPRTTALAQTVFRTLTRAGLVVGSSNQDEFAPVMAPDFFKGMSNVQALSGARQLRRLDENIAHRRRMTAVYDRLLRRSGWPVASPQPEASPALTRYPVRVADKELALVTSGKRLIELGSWFECPLHPIETPMEAYGYYPGLCPEAERASREVVNLPVHPRTDRETARRSVEFINRIGPAAAVSPTG
ncbi:MAG: hypothetical protein GY842_16090 [bacterium]|nr:hypothetical protein [bacterium]